MFQAQHRIAAIQNTQHDRSPWIIGITLTRRSISRPPLSTEFGRPAADAFRDIQMTQNLDARDDRRIYFRTCGGIFASTRTPSTRYAPAVDSQMARHARRWPAIPAPRHDLIHELDDRRIMRGRGKIKVFVPVVSRTLTRLHRPSPSTAACRAAKIFLDEPSISADGAITG